MSLTEPSTSYKPFKYPWAMEFAIQQEKIHWIEDEADLQEDVNQWKAVAGIPDPLTPNEKAHITQILRLFTQTDVTVAGNYVNLFLPVFKNNEIRNMLLSFSAREGIHQRAYALLNDTLGLAESEYVAFLDYPQMAEKVYFMEETNDVSGPEGIARALAQAVCNEGMSLFSAFVMLKHYERFGKMKGMCKIVEWSVRDESQHVLGMTKLFQTFVEEHPQVRTDQFKRSIYEMYRQAVDIEDRVIDTCFDAGPIDNLTADEMKAYIRFIADRRLEQLGLKANWGYANNPLPWVDWVISGDSHVNFFEQRVTDYNTDPFEGKTWWD
jgi:ribonucleoside-diphosphate reductase beta chain